MAATNLVLVGMPGAGKSTLGVMLAKRLAMDFVDTDVLIQVLTGRKLQDIVDGEGYRALRRIEERTILATAYRRHVIATGGSAVYSAAAMRHLKRRGRVVFLDWPFEVIRSRVVDLGSRGIAGPPGQALRAVFDERRPLYLAQADRVIALSAASHEAACDAVLRAVQLDAGP